MECSINRDSQHISSIPLTSADRLVTVKAIIIVSQPTLESQYVRNKNKNIFRFVYKIKDKRCCVPSSQIM